MAHCLLAFPCLFVYWRRGSSAWGIDYLSSWCVCPAGLASQSTTGYSGLLSTSVIVIQSMLRREDIWSVTSAGLLAMTPGQSSAIWRQSPRCILGGVGCHDQALLRHGLSPVPSAYRFPSVASHERSSLIAQTSLLVVHKSVQCW